MKARVHAVAGVLAIVLISLFMTTTVVTELVGDESMVRTVKTAILYALAVLIPSIMIAGASGRSLGAGRRSPILRAKKRRTGAVAAVGLLVLLPCAVVLQRYAAAGDFGATFLAVQAVELLGGATNLTLLVLNARAGRMLTAARRAGRGRAREAVAQS